MLSHSGAADKLKVARLGAADDLTVAQSKTADNLAVTQSGLARWNAWLGMRSLSVQSHLYNRKLDKRLAILLIPIYRQLPFLISGPHIHYTPSLRMSATKNDLTEDEQTLHHYAAVLEKTLVVYHACRSRDEKAWRNVFRKILVYFHQSHHSCMSG